MSNNNANNNVQSLASICQQRMNQLMHNIPPSRFVPISPYPNYNQKQLDMRRKVEILKYKNSSQSNKLTKAQMWVQMVKSPSKISQTARLICDNDNIPTPSYACDVPGPLTYFIKDNTVPLYNYLTNTRAYVDAPQVVTDPWNIFSDQNIFFPSGVSTKLFTMIFTNSVNNPTYVFSFTTPISLYVSGETTSSQKINIQDMSFAIQKMSLEVLYNENTVNLNTEPKYTNVADIPNVIFDISFVPQTITTYNILYYAGMITVSNIELYCQSGFVYDFYMTFDTKLSDNTFYTNNFATTNTGVYCNSNQSHTDPNIILNSSPIIEPHISLNVTGVAN
jgi:hypothetical protein